MKHARRDYNRIQDPAGLIPEDEPVFLIRGQDRAGPAALLAYAAVAEGLGSSPELVASVRRQARIMADYQASVQSKLPDAPAGVLLGGGMDWEEWTSNAPATSRLASLDGRHILLPADDGCGVPGEGEV